MGDALAQGNRRRRPSYQIRLYPELQKIPADDRDEALNDARKRALRSIPVIAASCTVPLLFAAMYWSYEPGADRVGPFLTGVAAVTSLLGVVFRWRVRRALLRSVWRPRLSPLSEAVEASKQSHQGTD